MSPVSTGLSLLRRREFFTGMGHGFYHLAKRKAGFRTTRLPPVAGGVLPLNYFRNLI